MQLSNEQMIELLALGAIIGFISGMIGIGGGVLVIPALVFLFSKNFTHIQAVGTSLAMLLPPIGIFAVMAHYQQGNVNIRAATLLACGFMVGGYFGGRLAGHVPEKALRMLFAFFILYVAGMMLFRLERRVWAVLQTVVMMTGFAIAYLVARATGKRWERALHLSAEYQRHLDEPLAPDYEI